jgi:hypothetical protein
MKQFLYGAFIVLILVLVLGNANNQNDNGKYQIASSNSFPDVFILDTSTGVLYRYAFTRPRVNVTGNELIYVETYGSPTKPEYRELQQLTGKEWSTIELRSRPIEQN